MAATSTPPRHREVAPVGRTRPESTRALLGRRSVLLALCGALMVAGAAISLAIGNRSIPLSVVVDALFAYDPDIAEHLVVRELRLPRTVLGLLAGAALSVAGVLMQALTRNPLAEPGILGVNAGAAFAVVFGSWALGLRDIGAWVWLALLGAIVSSVVVYALGSAGRGKPGPVRLVLAGAAVTALMFALTRAVVLVDQASLEMYRFWVAGSLSGRTLDVATTILPFVVVGMLVAFGVTRPLNSLSLGDETARALGLRVGLTKASTGAAVMLLAGAAVAAVGPIVFVGLVVPHAVRWAFGPDQRWLVPAAALAGPAILLVSDVIGRVIVRPGELQAGIVMAAIGGPIFIAIARRMRGETL